MNHLKYINSDFYTVSLTPSSFWKSSIYTEHNFNSSLSFNILVEHTLTWSVTRLWDYLEKQRKIVEKWNKYKRIVILANLTHSLMSPIIVPRQYFELYSIWIHISISIYLYLYLYIYIYIYKLDGCFTQMKASLKCYEICYKEFHLNLTLQAVVRDSWQSVAIP